MKKLDFPVGKKIKGYGLLNEFGEFDFIPEQTGSRTDGMKLLFEESNCKCFECKNELLFKFKIPKLGDNFERIRNILKVADFLTRKINDYEF